MKPKQQGKLLPAKKIRDLIQLQESGYSQNKIARECNVARSTVQDYLERAQKMPKTLLSQNFMNILAKLKHEKIEFTK
jgi:predicted transcriptional regulator